MSSFITSKINGNQVDADEWNQLADYNTLLSSSGQTPSSSNINQGSIAAARYASAGQYFLDSGTANAYVLSPVAPFKAPVDATVGYFVGMIIRFRAGNANSGASTVNVNSAGVKNLKKEDGTTDLVLGDVPTTRDSTFRYNGTAFCKIDDDKNNYAKLSYQLASGSNGGGATAAAWSTRPLNTKLFDPNGIVSLSSNQFTLQAGTYKISAIQSFSYSGSTAALSSSGRIRNITDSSTPSGAIAVNCSICENLAGAIGWQPKIEPFIVTITSTKVFELQYYTPVAQATYGLGEPCSSGEVEVYASVFIQKI